MLSPQGAGNSIATDKRNNLPKKLNFVHAERKSDEFGGDSRAAPADQSKNNSKCCSHAVRMKIGARSPAKRSSAHLRMAQTGALSNVSVFFERLMKGTMLSLSSMHFSAR
jgi:hypothetical protein